MSLGGVAVSVANLISTAFGDAQPYWDSHCAADRFLLQEKCRAYERVDEAVFLYFFLGSVTLGLCMLGFSYIVRITRHQEDLGAYGSVAREPVSPNATPRMGLELPAARQNETQELVPDGSGPDGALPTLANSTTNKTVQVWSQIQAPAIAIFLVFVVTLSLFPAWTSQIRSSQQCLSTNRLRNDLFTPMSFVLFNGGDLAGRLLSTRIPLGGSQDRSQWLLNLASLRFIFYILLFLCPSGENGSLMIRNDLYTVLVLLLFAVSNGYIVSAAFCHAPCLVESVPELQERMAEILNFSLSAGLLVGSLLSFPVVAIMSG
jgi:Nucleoside transporter